jgi:hypothetical protein
VWAHYRCTTLVPQDANLTTWRGALGDPIDVLTPPFDIIGRGKKPADPFEKFGRLQVRGTSLFDHFVGVHFATRSLRQGWFVEWRGDVSMSAAAPRLSRP